MECKLHRINICVCYVDVKAPSQRSHAFTCKSHVDRNGFFRFFKYYYRFTYYRNNRWKICVSKSADSGGGQVEASSFYNLYELHAISLNIRKKKLKILTILVNLMSTYTIYFHYYYHGTRRMLHQPTL